MLNLSWLLAESAETGAGETSAVTDALQPPADMAYLTFFLTVGLSLLLLVVFVVILLPHRKVSPIGLLMRSLTEARTLAAALQETPTAAMCKKLGKSLRVAANRCDLAIFKGLVELKSILPLLDESIKICRCIVVVKSDEEAAKFAARLLENVAKAYGVAAPYDKKELDDSALTLKTKSGAANYLRSIGDGNDADEK